MNRTFYTSRVETREFNIWSLNVSLPTVSSFLEVPIITLNPTLMPVCESLPVRCVPFSAAGPEARAAGPGPGAAGLGPGLLGGLITSLQPLRIHSSPVHHPRAPTLPECEVIIRQLYNTNSLQSQEVRVQGGVNTTRVRGLNPTGRMWLEQDQG